jgi:hypothetical protein
MKIANKSLHRTAIPYAQLPLVSSIVRFHNGTSLRFVMVYVTRQLMAIIDTPMLSILILPIAVLDRVPAGDTIGGTDGHR